MAAGTASETRRTVYQKQLFKRDRMARQREGDACYLERCARQFACKKMQHQIWRREQRANTEHHLHLACGFGFVTSMCICEAGSRLGRLRILSRRHPEIRREPAGAPVPHERESLLTANAASWCAPATPPRQLSVTQIVRAAAGLVFLAVRLTGNTRFSAGAAVGPDASGPVLGKWNAGPLSPR